MKRIILIRHGQSEWNIDNRVQGTSDTNLTEIGLEQAEKLAQAMSKYKIDRLYSSELKRAKMTAEILGDKINKDVIVNKAFNEMDFGIWQGVTMADIKVQYPDDFRIWMEDPGSLQIEGGESLSSLRDKLEIHLGSLVDEMDEEESIAIVTHGTTLKSILLLLLDLPFSYYKNFAISNVSISIIEIRDYNNVLVGLNDTNHLEDVK